jgi:hypothetical protein
MQRNKHTPGPWRAETLPKDRPGEFLTVYIRSQSQLVCEIPAIGYGDLKERVANAELIASAPALAAKLEKIRPMAESMVADYLEKYEPDSEWHKTMMELIEALDNNE